MQTPIRIRVRARARVRVRVRVRDGVLMQLSLHTPMRISIGYGQKLG
jgi:hypothetical protein